MEGERERERENRTKCVNVVQLWISSCLGRPHGMAFHFRKGLHAFVKLRKSSIARSEKPRAKKICVRYCTINR